ncbi:MAG: N-acetyltransferase [Spirochaetaceae bacterium]
MVIRQETSNDYNEVYNLVKTSFATTDFSDGSEPDYLNGLRKKDSFIPELSLVAELDKKIIGQVVLTKTDIVCDKNKLVPALLLSPICVHTEHFKQGIGTKLMDEAFKLAVNMGYSSVFLCGNPNYYEKKGFKASYLFKIYHVNDSEKNATWCMVKELKEGCLDQVTGFVDIT